jgi:tetratricopeptide (TPR) repeat protein
MASDQAKDLRQRGIAAAKAGQKEEARQLLQQSLRIEPNNESAWLWLASVARDQRERLFSLQKVLEINPTNDTARKALEGPAPSQPPPPPPGAPAIRSLSISRPPSSASTTPAAVSPPSPSATGQEIGGQTPGVPVPGTNAIAEAQKQAEMVVREYTVPISDPVKWVHKTRRRAGERDVLLLRVYIAAAVIGALLVVGGGLFLFVTTNPDARSVLFAPTPTMTYTPTITPSPTPGLTPTPSPTPALTLTPSPTVPSNIPTSNPYVPPTPTSIYPPIGDNTLKQAILQMDHGQYSLVIPTLQAIQRQNANTFDANSYYYQAIALAENGDTDQAERLMTDAEGRLTTSSSNTDNALVNAGFAYVYAKMAEDSEAKGESGRSNWQKVQERAQAAIDADPRVAEPYILLAKSYASSSDYENAISAVDQGLQQPDLATNLNLIVEKGQVYYQQGELDLAQYQAFLVLYINPAIESAHLLQIQVALAKNDPGLAVIYTQNYLFYFTGSALGYKLLGDARVAEGNTDLALAAYTQALAGGTDAPGALQALESRADLYNQQKRYDLARQDYTDAMRLTDDPQIQAKRMIAAYNAGNYSTANDDATALLGSGVLPDSELKLYQARILVDQAQDNERTKFQQALTLLGQAGSGLPADLTATADEYKARADFAVGNFPEALTAINNALDAGENGSRHYWRGRILEAQGKKDEAAREYEWVVSWSLIYPYSFRVDAQDRLTSLSSGG